MQNHQTIVYRIPLDVDDQTLAAARSVLSVDEGAKADRFLVEPPRRQYSLCRRALRVVIGRTLNCDPTAVHFRAQRYGKPELDFGRMKLEKSDLKLAQTLQFNVSHSGDLGLIALSLDPIGVDIEKLQPRINAKSLMTQVVSPKELALWQSLAASQHTEQILRLWVCKEALLKAMGLGIAECLKQISFPLPIGTQPLKLSHIDPSVQLHLNEAADCRCNSWVLPTSWRIQPLAIDPGYYAAVATMANCEEVKLVDFED